MNCLRSVPAFAGCFLELKDLYWVLRSTNVFFTVSWYFYDESEINETRNTSANEWRLGKHQDSRENKTVSLGN